MVQNVPSPSPSRRGVMLVISSPSGAGKSALSRALLDKDDKDREGRQQIVLSVSVTTRAKRPSEIDGVHYHFVDIETFERMRDRGELLEWAEVHGNFYATPRKPVEAALTDGRDVLFDIDVQGTLQLYRSMREDVVSVFILPPSIAELQNRLRRRAEDAEAVIRRRLHTAERELEAWQDYDYVLVNEDLDTCFQQLQSILLSERLKRARNPALAGRLAILQKDLNEVLAQAR
ncbi:MAG: guanylate kinase [Methylobacterium sp.]|nr:guanylate kinase [Methylobacterium sp.]MCA3600100.1 guanylate kinase [Methylobacterium sp.]MCA3604535.1 guanylate kinase [Methylobacterium sp.]MCA3611741.1 guanylate kinase [Methylobacterium sp.]MCA3613982.1 guanylate kinase [Methylobacterium sp.]